MEQLDTILQKLGGALLWQKLVGLLVCVLLLGGGYYWFFLGDIWAQRDQMLADQKKLVQEKQDYEARKKEYLAYKAEIATLLEEQRNLLRLLPKADDIEQFIEAMQQQIELAGLTKTTLIRNPGQQRDLYIRLPVKTTVTGTYHQVMRFLKAMGEIQRIVNIEDLTLAPVAAQADKAQAQDILKADFLAVAFQYSNKPVATPKVNAGGVKSVATAGGGK